MRLSVFPSCWYCTITACAFLCVTSGGNVYWTFFVWSLFFFLFLFMPQHIACLIITGKSRPFNLVKNRFVKMQSCPSIHRGTGVKWFSLCVYICTAFQRVSLNYISLVGHSVLICLLWFWGNEITRKTKNYRNKPCLQIISSLVLTCEVLGVDNLPFFPSNNTLYLALP